MEVHGLHDFRRVFRTQGDANAISREVTCHDKELLEAFRTRWEKAKHIDAYDTVGGSVAVDR